MLSPEYVHNQPGQPHWSLGGSTECSETAEANKLLVRLSATKKVISQHFIAKSNQST